MFDFGLCLILLSVLILRLRNRAIFRVRIRHGLGAIFLI